MTRTNKNRPSLTSLATDREQAETATYRGCERNNNAAAEQWRLVAAMLVARARGAVEELALVIDDPPAGIVEAADLLDLAAEAMSTRRQPPGGGVP